MNILGACSEYQDLAFHLSFAFLVELVGFAKFIMKKFRGKILVIGDIMLDHYIYGKVNRILGTCSHYGSIFGDILLIGMVVDLPKDSSQYPQIITEMKEFDVLKITEEDTKRSDMYLGQKKRKELENKVGDYNEFLKQMNIEVNVEKANSFSIPRISQLTLKTNQFNLTTRRYQEEEVSKFSSSEDKIVECVKVSDKFGDNGITGTYIIEKKDNDEWIIDTFLLSCRIMGRGVEEIMMNQIIEKAKSSGIKKIKGEFIPTKKNKPAENFYEKLGFKKEDEFWVFDTDNIMKKPEHIKVIKNE